MTVPSLSSLGVCGVNTQVFEHVALRRNGYAIHPAGCGRICVVRGNAMVDVLAVKWPWPRREHGQALTAQVSDVSRMDISLAMTVSFAVWTGPFIRVPDVISQRQAR
ncbi:MAG: hypothetical protein HGA75_13675 [Thiobacillus sp.]|nr:hypothetical protein [Thiobacillus sp.]